jgi:hypothetical protein
MGGERFFPIGRGQSVEGLIGFTDRGMEIGKGTRTNHGVRPFARSTAARENS